MEADRGSDRNVVSVNAYVEVVGYVYAAVSTRSDRQGRGLDIASAVKRIGSTIVVSPVWGPASLLPPFRLQHARSHKGPRLSNGGSTDARKLADRAKAHELILGHARMAGIPRDSAEMQHFARELFLLSRQCGAAGLEKESERLFHLAREASLPHRAAA